MWGAGRGKKHVSRTKRLLRPKQQHVEGGTIQAMNLEILLDRETDGRWIAEISDLNLLLYGATREEAIQKIEAAAIEIIVDRIKRGTLPADAAHPIFGVAA